LENELKELEKVECFNEMDFKITEKEIMQCIKHLKNKKAVGLDLISNEMLKYSQHAMLPVLIKLFNVILSSRKFPRKWCEGYVVPIPKGSDKANMSDYRGLTMLNCMTKLFNAVIDKRITKYLESQRVMDEKQIGFKKGSRTSDHMFILRNLIEKYAKSGTKLYACFVDLRKAYDSVDHLKLMYKLKQIGIGSHVYDILKDMYVNIGSMLCVKSGNCLSGSFVSNVGVRQGDNLSPNLFKIYLNDIQQYLTPDVNTPVLGTKTIEYLLYADDMVLLSQTEEGLQRSLNGLSKYCKEWNLTVNIDKTKVLVFNKPGRLIKTTVNFNNKQIENVTNYKYLGIMFSASGSFVNAKKDLLQRGYKAMFKLTSLFKQAKPGFITSMHLFDHMVKPVLLYGADIWGDCWVNTKSSLYNALKNDIVEICHMKFCKYILGVNKRTTNIGVYGDTGRYPLTCSAALYSIKYWHRIANMNIQDDGLLQSALKENLSCDSQLSWVTNICRMLSTMNETMDTVLNKSTNYTRQFLKALTDVFRNGWQRELFTDERKQGYGNKLRCYRSFKTEFK
jgi:hypothetical protein